MLCDNKKRSIGMERQALLDVAKGDYVAFVDDDDDVVSYYVRALVPAQLVNHAPDLLLFNTAVTLDANPTVVCGHFLESPDEQYSSNGFRRSAWQMHAWRRSIAQSARFPDANFSEDFGWVTQLRPKVKYADKIDDVLYHYRFNSKTTEA